MKKYSHYNKNNTVYVQKIKVKMMLILKKWK